MRGRLPTRPPCHLESLTSVGVRDLKTERPWPQHWVRIREKNLLRIRVATFPECNLPGFRAPQQECPEHGRVSRERCSRPPSTPVSAALRRGFAGQALERGTAALGTCHAARDSSFIVHHSSCPSPGSRIKSGMTTRQYVGYAPSPDPGLRTPDRKYDSRSTVNGTGSSPKTSWKRL